ncbi:hypothetical protein [Piscinibacter sp.]|uniref:hypothetical protein n=1 Tax=Piscinibacter sp. TaxID=1903157 RepID=UPI002D803564|nr:hypothetical protein [Albitalea sp.]
MSNKRKTIRVCHALLEDPKFSALLLRIDHELAEQTRSEGCRCGGALHRADYPRKPRGCPRHLRPDHSSRLSFCCALCRKRSTSKSVRFLGRRVYLALAVVLVSARPAGPAPAASRLGQALGVARRTIARWRQWWREQFPLTPLWRTACARFMPPVTTQDLPGELLARFEGPAHEALMRLLIWLSPLTHHGAELAVIELREGR